jgi:hypothetical protein
MQVSFPRLPVADQPAVLVRLNPEDAGRIPGAPSMVQGRHVIVAVDATVTDDEIKAPMSALRILALGDTDEAVCVFVPAPSPRLCALPSEAQPQSEVVQHGIRSAPDRRVSGDNAFIAALSEIGPDMQRIGAALLGRIRERYTGELVGTDHPRKFVESPDNFWAVEVQNRLGQIKFIIRAREMRLREAGIEFSSERPPSYFYVKIQSDRDIERALQFLALADRK